MFISDDNSFSGYSKLIMMNAEPRNETTIMENAEPKNETTIMENAKPL